uniref:Uncharacterized protein n=1 Tax=Trichobilharzia regenti TaxID=157069 RepID=A0AA85J4P5_TRIRE|nr:unnamed protein product [Trichobilharzia regenti]
MNAESYDGSEEARAEVLIKRPTDPVEYLGRCLKMYAQLRNDEIKESAEADGISDSDSLDKLDNISEEIEKEKEKSESDDGSNSQIEGGIIRKNSQTNGLLDSGMEQKVNDEEDREVHQQSDLEDSVRETQEDEQSISKFGNESEDEVTFDSQSKQDVNDTPYEDVGDLHDEKSITDSEA